ncbi:sulfotransferase family protein [Ilumatobacter sp.]|uniref:sulfotransferase family protein n=1 Tax=Ilumatobacter sp. TaxID=1967498 RepID=UPI003B51B2BE
MSLRVIGAGLPRTGTNSIKLALERLTGAPCYHMHEVFANQHHPALWCRALDGEVAVLDEILADYTCAVDWPVSSMWREAAERYPDAPVLLSLRDDAETWWGSVDATVWAVMRGPRDGVASPEWWAMTERLQARFAPDWDDPATARAAYEEHLERVRSTIPADRLFEHRPGDGWGPLCAALGVAVPEEEYPHVNTRAEFGSRLGSRGDGGAPDPSS